MPLYQKATIFEFVVKREWLEQVLAIVDVKDEVDRVKMRRAEVQERLRRVGKTYIDKLILDEEYHHQRRMLNGNCNR